MNKKLVGVLCVGLAWQGLPAVAWGVEGVSISGFLTAGATYADRQILSGVTPGAPGASPTSVSQDGTIENTVGFTADSRLGIQVSARVNPDISVTGQLLARARDENSDVRADWAFLTYRLAEPVSVRAGKIKFPTFLISDYYEVGYAYPWIRPPQEVYFSNPISTLNGVDVLARVRLGDMALLFQPYFGVSRGAEALVPQEVIAMGMVPGATQGMIVNIPFTADNLAGVNLSLGSEAFTIRAGYLQTDVSAPVFGVYDDRAEFASAGLTMDWHNVVLYSEYFAREINGVANLAFPNQKGWYGTLGYRFGKWLPHVTHARVEDNDNPALVNVPAMMMSVPSTPLEQKSTTIGLRYELGGAAALKIEAQQVTPEEGTRGLLIANPNNPALEDPGEDVMIYGIAIDVVF